MPLLVSIPDLGLYCAGHITAPWKSLIALSRALANLSPISYCPIQRAPWYQIWKMLAFLYWESLLKLAQVCSWTEQTLLALQYPLMPIAQWREVREEVQEVQGCSAVFWTKKRGKNSLRQTPRDHISVISQSTFRNIYAFVGSVSLLWRKRLREQF